MLKRIGTLVFLIIMTLIVLNAEAATTATLLLKGVVPAVLNVSIAPETVAATLPLDVTQNNTKVGTLTEQSNSFTGYKITLTSQNLGRLALDSNNYVNYTLSYNNLPVNIASVAGQTFSFGWTNAAPVNKDLRVSYNAQNLSTMAAGNYVDTVTVTIAPN